MMFSSVSFLMKYALFFLVFSASVGSDFLERLHLYLALENMSVVSSRMVVYCRWYRYRLHPGKYCLTAAQYSENCFSCISLQASLPPDMAGSPFVRPCMVSVIALVVKKYLRHLLSSALCYPL
jgi:hypothetical protein